MRDADAVMSALPYYLNLDMARLAVEAGAPFTDLGGNTEIVLEQSYHVATLDHDADRILEESHAFVLRLAPAAGERSEESKDSVGPDASEVRGPHQSRQADQVGQQEGTATGG